MLKANEVEAWLVRLLEGALGIPILRTFAETPAGVGGYGLLHFVELRDGRAIGTRTYRYRLTITPAAEAEEPLAHRFVRTMLDRLTDLFDTLGELRDADPFESLVMSVERYEPRLVEVIIDAEVLP